MDGEEIVRLARGWIGTPFFHTGREKGVACDCVGLLIGVGNEAGLLDGYDHRKYARVMPEGTTRREVEKFCDLVAGGWDPAAVQAGDILLFRLGGLEQHTAFAAGDGWMVHAHEGAKEVVEQEVVGAWVRSCTGVYRFRGLD